MVHVGTENDYDDDDDDTAEEDDHMSLCQALYLLEPQTSILEQPGTTHINKNFKLPN
jgi:hypothetical protein